MKSAHISKMVPEVDFIGQLADLKEVDYKNMLVLTGLIELLIEKELITRKEVIEKAEQLEADLSFLDVLE
ncbi:hypothetical protein [Tepidibacillus fermentans]|uniref:Uncharacterized protein n=1 Tax=Tepidibacillus fermentans TaxID=1281767 RepID=A0A4R3KDQ6_9BACI|nr:hypothetical protein [Tepidibacillus fermentans]TCS80781.1 hypothetical protein EDD72_1155 [Tepidibacillus fermentans]